MTIQAIIRSTRDAGAVDRPRSTHREDLVTVLLATWLIAGLGLDGWAHNQLEGRLEYPECKFMGELREPKLTSNSF